MAVVLATQGLADLERVDRALPTQIVQNTAVRVVLSQQSSEDALAWARHLGELEREDVSRRLKADGGWFGGARDTKEYTTRWRRDFYVRVERPRYRGRAAYLTTAVGAAVAGVGLPAARFWPTALPAG